MARRQHGIEKPESGLPEPEPVAVEEADEVADAEEEVVVTPVLDDVAESDAPRRLR